MAKIATTRMSSKGQVVIPEEVRKALGLEPGSEFVVVAEDDVVVLKRLTPPSMEDFDDILEEARRRAREAGMEPSHIEAALRAARSSR